MLVAKRDNGKWMSLVKPWSKKILLHLRMTEQFYCLGCGQQVRLKLGGKRRWHFAHLNRNTCFVQADRESPYHMEGKIQLYHWLKGNHVAVVLEPYLSSIQQRPDILVFYEGKKIAVEFQCSSIPLELVKKRTDNYKRIGITVIWIIAGSRLEQKKEHQFYVTPFEWLFLRFHHSPYLIYYCPNNKAFSILTNVHPFSSHLTLAKRYNIPASSMNINQLFSPPQGSKKFPIAAWFGLKSYWRRYTPLTPPSEDIFIRQLIFKKNDDIPYLPSEVGLPTPAQFTIKTQSVYWQSWIIIALLHPMKIGSCITFEKICKEFRFKVDQKIFQVRELPCINDCHFSIAIMEFLQLLIKLRILGKIKERAFIKQKDFQFPKTMNEAVSRDKIVQQQLFF